MIYLLYNIKEQNIKDQSYLDFIKFCNNHNRLILDNNRINIRIKENLLNLKCQLNLGFLAKHLTWNIDEITFDKSTDNGLIEQLSHGKVIESKPEILIELKKKLKTMTNKYYKYKMKYLKIKQPNMEIGTISDTSIRTPKNDNNGYEI